MDLCTIHGLDGGVGEHVGFPALTIDLVHLHGMRIGSSGGMHPSSPGLHVRSARFQEDFPVQFSPSFLASDIASPTAKYLIPSSECSSEDRAQRLHRGRRRLRRACLLLQNSRIRFVWLLHQLDEWHRGGRRFFYTMAVACAAEPLERKQLLKAREQRTARAAALVHPRAAKRRAPAQTSEYSAVDAPRDVQMSVTPTSRLCAVRHELRVSKTEQCTCTRKGHLQMVGSRCTQL